MKLINGKELRLCQEGSSLSMNGIQVRKVFLTVSCLFNLFWIGSISRNIFHVFNLYRRMHEYGIDRELICKDWRVELFKGNFTFLTTCRGSYYDSCFCNEEDGLPLFFCSTVIENGDAQYSAKKMCLATSSFFLSWNYDAEGKCSNISIRYNGHDSLVDRMGNGVFESGILKSKEVVKANTIKCPDRGMCVDERIINLSKSWGGVIPDESFQQLSSVQPSGTPIEVGKCFGFVIEKPYWLSWWESFGGGGKGQLKYARGKSK